MSKKDPTLDDRVFFYYKARVWRLPKENLPVCKGFFVVSKDSNDVHP